MYNGVPTQVAAGVGGSGAAAGGGFAWHIFGPLGLIVLGLTILFALMATGNLVPAKLRRRTHS